MSVEYFPLIGFEGVCACASWLHFHIFQACVVVVNMEEVLLEYEIFSVCVYNGIQGCSGQL